VNLESSTAAGAAVLVVDDELANVALIESILYRSGMTNVRGTTDPTTVAAMFRQERPDVLLVDLHMPVLSGMELLAQSDGWRHAGEYLPVFVLSDDTSMRAKLDALDAGATDFLSKPFDARAGTGGATPSACRGPTSRSRAGSSPSATSSTP